MNEQVAAADAVKQAKEKAEVCLSAQILLLLLLLLLPLLPLLLLLLLLLLRRGLLLLLSLTTHEFPAGPFIGPAGVLGVSISVNQSRRMGDLVS